MFSLKNAISQIDHEEQLFRSATDCYTAALSAIRKYALAGDNELSRESRRKLHDIEATVAETREPEVLDQSREILQEVLRDHYDRVEAAASEKVDNLRVVMTALSEAAQLLGQQSIGQSDKLRIFTDRLNASARTTDLGMMRRQIVGHVAELRLIRDQTQKESDRTLSELQSQLAEFSKRLDTAERRATLDALTGLLNRGEGELRLRRLIESGADVCAIVIDLNGFKRINDTWGHVAGDQVLKVCARILLEQTRSSDLLCRWGGDEFLIAIRCELRVAAERAKLLKQKLRVPHKIVVTGKIFDVGVSASIGHGIIRPGETMEDFVARADREMYQDKSESRESRETRG